MFHPETREKKDLTYIFFYFSANFQSQVAKIYIWITILLQSVKCCLKVLQQGPAITGHGKIILAPQSNHSTKNQTNEALFPIKIQ